MPQRGRECTPQSTPARARRMRTRTCQRALCGQHEATTSLEQRLGGRGRPRHLAGVRAGPRGSSDTVCLLATAGGGMPNAATILREEYRITLYSAGGCQPTLTHSLRAETMSSLFSFSASTVTRPHGVNPMIRAPSPDQAKCSRQDCWRGLNNGTCSPVSMSVALIWMLLYSLQKNHTDYP